MKLLGILFGAKVYLDTKDNQVFAKAEDFLQKRLAYKPKTDTELREEVDKALGVK